MGKLTHIAALPAVPAPPALPAYLFSLNPAGTATSAADTSVTTFRISVVLDITLVRPF
jgi:hypothetical protein